MQRMSIFYEGEKLFQFCALSTTKTLNLFSLSSLGMKINIFVNNILINFSSWLSKTWTYSTHAHSYAFFIQLCLFFMYEIFLLTFLQPLILNFCVFVCFMSLVPLVKLCGEGTWVSYEFVIFEITFLISRGYKDIWG